MRTKSSLDLSDAKAIVAAAERYAEWHELRVSIAVVDESTYVLHLVRMDGALYMSPEGAVEKARTAAEGGHPTTLFEESLNAGRYSMLKLPIYRSRAASPSSSNVERTAEAAPRATLTANKETDHDRGPAAPRRRSRARRWRALAGPDDHAARARVAALVRAAGGGRARRRRPVDGRAASDRRVG